MKTNISLTYYGKPQKQRETYVLFAVTLFFRKTEIESVLCFGLFFCLTLVHLVWAGEGRGGGELYFTGRVQTPWGGDLEPTFLWSELAAVIYERARSAIDGLARWERHLTAVIPIHRRIIQANSLGFKHLSDWVKVLLLCWVRCAQVAQVSGLIEVPGGQPPLMGMVALLHWV